MGRLGSARDTTDTLQGLLPVSPVPGTGPQQRGRCAGPSLLPGASGGPLGLGSPWTARRQMLAHLRCEFCWPLKC